VTTINSAACKLTLWGIILARCMFESNVILMYCIGVVWRLYNTTQALYKLLLSLSSWTKTTYAITFQTLWNLCRSVSPVVWGSLP